MKPFAMFGALVLAAFGGSTLPAAETVEDLAAQATREYDILAPSLRTAAMELLEEIRAHHKKNPRKPSIDWDHDEKNYKTFVDLEFDGKESSDKFVLIPTEAHFVVSATARSFRYKLDCPDRIIRTGLRDRPFAGTVWFQVTITDRVASVECSEAVTVPKRYRPATGNGGMPIATLSFGSVAHEVDGVTPPYPLPYCGAPHRRDEGWPKVVKGTVPELYKRCQKAKPVTKTESHKVTFWYSLAKKKWEWQWPAEEDELDGD